MTETASGAGLGPHIAQGIIAAYQGKIKAERNPAVGGGTGLDKTESVQYIGTETTTF